MSTDEKAPSQSQSTGGHGNDFVKKLYEMLEDSKYGDVVRWTQEGDSFVVIDTNEFTKNVLPHFFKHSNFSSFVRQLNKYSFKKKKRNTNEDAPSPYGPDAWQFFHPEFRQNQRETLENIKRKGPGTRKAMATVIPPEGIAHTCHGQPQLVASLKEQVEQLKHENFNLHKSVTILENKYKTVIDNIVAVNTVNERNFRSMAQLLDALAQHGIKLPPLDFPNPQLVSMQAPPRAAVAPVGPPPPMAPPVVAPGAMPQPPMPPHGPMPAPPVPPPVATPASAPVLMEPKVEPGVHLDAKAKFNVLLVEDDNICIQLCRKFLVKYGCEVTVVTDGLNAISTVEETKFDLVLMDIVMPNLDGATATSIIRSFDTRTPIIAMTGNIEDTDLVNYLNNGMSDILAKPFSKDDLYCILEKHLLKRSDGPPTAASTPAPLGPTNGNPTEPAMKKPRLK
ncbi:hypothetical protein DIURU_002488 [Diutina rugosa]|uniref:Transcription factor n=1 Tax=Diutina rugosa TaxID=5481 RepID=A0A642UQ10_DIURU|nr:uncharacterized protein DIURU_002488 [Diutina rugosa]KAA8903326.1 hypothetical protein DIURU_002488 [Diutina rugosa]